MSWSASATTGLPATRCQNNGPHGSARSRFYLRLLEYQVESSGIGRAGLTGTGGDAQTGHLGAVRGKLQAVDDPRGHRKIGIPVSKLRFKSREELLLAAVPGDENLHARNPPAGGVVHIHLQQPAGQVWIADLLLRCDREGCSGSGRRRGTRAGGGGGDGDESRAGRGSGRSREGGPWSGLGWRRGAHGSRLECPGQHDQHRGGVVWVSGEQQLLRLSVESLNRIRVLQQGKP